MAHQLYHNFIIALMSLGCNDQERARALGISTKSIGRYRDGLLPEPLRRMMQYPILIEALAADAVVLAHADAPTGMNAQETHNQRDTDATWTISGRER